MWLVVTETRPKIVGCAYSRCIDH